MPSTRGGRRASFSDEVVPATDGVEEDEFSDNDVVRSRNGRKRKRSSPSNSSKSSPAPASRWTRQPPKPVVKKKKKLIAGRELRDRGSRKAYTELSSSDSEFEDDSENLEEEVEEPDAGDEVAEEEEEIDKQPRTRKIILKLNAGTLQQLSQRVETPKANGAEHIDVEDAEIVEDLEAEVQDLTADMKQDNEEDDDDEGGPRLLNRRVTRQSSISKKETVPDRPVHGRKGVARQDRSPERTNGDRAPSAEENDQRRSMRSRLRDEVRRPSHEEKKKKKPHVSESEFEDEGDDDQDDDISILSDAKRANSEEDYSSRSPQRRPRKAGSRGKPKQSRNVSDNESFDEDIEDIHDLEEELRDIGAEIPQRQRQLRPTERMNYFIPPPPDKDDIFLPAPTSSKKRSGGGRGFGGFGGFGGDFSTMGLSDRFRGIAGLGKAGGAEDSSDSDEDARQRRPSAALGSLIPSGGGISGLSGTPANLGKYTPKSKLADADPLGVDQNIDFTAVGGLDDYINQLKEMVTLPLLYPEIFQRFDVTPPRGVLFHGPPGTGKTLMARALAASCSTEGRKIAFFMRKGADCLSKWVGEAERQLRLLFEEAKNSQPSIIFFDEIDGLAPVRSSKQEQIHASIVSTLLALMDGMDGRGQVIVIGATNRPDAVDPALRRPGRFDREFYFPLPDIKARKSIIDIHTRKWDPPLEEDFKMQLALQTKGYGGADLRALCTEAALNAVQRRYPQIYSSTDKLVVDPKSINVTARDFMIATEKIVPSSERSSSSGAAPLPKAIKPLLESKLEEIKSTLSTLIPEKKKRNILEEAAFEDDGLGAFESARTFRPRLLVHGDIGMGQQYLGAAILHHLEKTHVQSFDLATLMGDSARVKTLEAALVQLFAEVKRHKPSVIYVPNMDLWFRTISDAARDTFMTLIRGISPSDPILLLGLVELPLPQLDPDLRAIFGYSLQNRVEVASPQKESRYEFFKNALSNINKAPTDFPDAIKKRKRVPEALEKAPPPPPKVWTKAELQEQALKDKQTQNSVKLKLSGLMDLLKKRYQRFRKSIIDDRDLALLARGEQDPECLAHTKFRRNEDGTIRDVTNNKRFHNMDLDIVSDRLWNGFYLTPDQFVFDIQCMVHDAKTWPDRDRSNRAEEMLVNSQTYVFEAFEETLILECQRMAEREFERQKIAQAEREAKAKKKAERDKEKERLRLAAAQQGEEGHSPSKMIIEASAIGDEQMLDVNEDGGSGLGIMTNGHGNGASDDATNQVVPESSPFESQQLTSQSQMCPPVESISPTQTQPYQPPPAHIDDGLVVPSYNPYPPPINQPMAPMQPYPFTNMQHGIQQQPPFSGPYQSTNPGVGMYTHAYANNPAQTTHYQPSSAQNIGTFPVLNHQMAPPQITPPSTGHHLQLGSQLYQPPHVPGPYGGPHPHATSTTSATLMTTPQQPQHRMSPRPVSPRPIIAPHSSLKKDPAGVEKLLQDITHQTEGYTLEQLEQVYATCMDIIWKRRHEWDRTVVIVETEKCVKRVLHEIEMMKKERQQDQIEY